MNTLTIVIISILVALAIIVALTLYFKHSSAQYQQNLDWLRQNGKRITAYAKEVEVHKTGDYDDPIRYATYHLIAEWTQPETGQTYIFKSIIPKSALPPHYTPGSDVTFEVPVVIDPKNPRNYVIDLPAES